MIERCHRGSLRAMARLTAMSPMSGSSEVLDRAGHDLPFEVLLVLQAETRGGVRFESFGGDRLLARFADAVGAILEHPEGPIDILESRVVRLATDRAPRASRSSDRTTLKFRSQFLEARAN